jgi:hypothetical protein
MPHPTPSDPFPSPMPPPRETPDLPYAVDGVVIEWCPFDCGARMTLDHRCPDLIAAVGHVHWPPRSYTPRAFIPTGRVA